MMFWFIGVNFFVAVQMELLESASVLQGLPLLLFLIGRYVVHSLWTAPAWVHQMHVEELVSDAAWICAFSIRSNLCQTVFLECRRDITLQLFYSWFCFWIF